MDRLSAMEMAATSPARVRRIVWIALALIAGWPAGLQAQEYIRIASFNIAEFGEGDHAETRELGEIAKMLVDNDLDLIAIQEVGVKEGGVAQVRALRGRMNRRRARRTPKYFSIVTPQSGDERCAVIYRSPVTLDDDEITWLDEDKNPDDPSKGGEVFFRIPPTLAFSAGEFDFNLVQMHLAWGNLTRRTDEVTALHVFLESESDGEQDWIVLGDMNRYGKFRASADKAFDILLADGWKQSYRFPLLEAITDPDDMDVRRASEDRLSTTVADSRNLYDQIIVTAGVYRELGADDPVLGTDVGIIAFDMEPRYADLDHNEVKYRVSDHRPVWIRLRIDLDDDD